MKPALKEKASRGNRAALCPRLEPRLPFQHRRAVDSSTSRAMERLLGEREPDTDRKLTVYKANLIRQT